MTDRRLLSPAGVLLLNAADYIETHGWCQGKAEDPEHRVCMMGALGKVSQVSDDIRAAVLAIDKRLGPMYASNLARWNDTIGRTQAEVVEALQQAALEYT